MMLRASDLRQKDVVSVRNGMRLGQVCDFEIDVMSSCVTSLIVYGGCRCFGLLGRRKDMVIRWNDITLIGEDTILVSCDTPKNKKKRRR